MRKNLLYTSIFFLAFFAITYAYQRFPGGVVVGDRVLNHSSAVFQIESSSGGFLPPRMSQASRDAIATPASGLTIYNEDSGYLEVYNGSSWVLAGLAGGGLTEGSVVIANSSGLISEDNPGITYVASTNQLTVEGEIVASSLTVDTGPAVVGSGTEDSSSIFEIFSGSQGSRPWPSMTQASRDAIATPASGLAIYNSDTNQVNVYDGTSWGEVGGGGLDEWATGTIYEVGDVVYNEDQIYVATAGHTAGATFAGDSANWDELSPMDFNHPVAGINAVANGGTGLDASTASDGQILIGNDGTDGFDLATITGTANQVNVANGAGSITLSAPQDLHTGASPTFAGMTLSGLTPSKPVQTNGSSVLVAADVDLTSQVTGILPPANGGTGVDGSTASDGQVLIGNGTGYTLSTITGTTNQVSVTNGSGSITLATPQDIHTGASPEFVGLTLSGLTQNSVPYIGAGGVVTEDNPGITYDGSTLALSNGGASTLLDLTQSGSGTAFNINNSGTGDFIVVDTSAFIVQNDGDVGIGVAAPDDALEVSGAATIDNIRASSNTISTVNTNGDLLLDPDGTGDVYRVDASANQILVGSRNPELANLLAYPSFEESIAEGSCTGCTASAETSVVIHGSQSLEMAFSAASGNYVTTKTTGSEYSNVQMLASCFIKTSAADVTFVAQADGSDVSNGSVSVSTNDVWEEYYVGPFTAGTTSVGLKINAASSITDSVFVDNCKLRAVDADYWKVMLTDVDSAVYNTMAGYGSTNTKIVYFSNEITNDTGNVVTVANDSTNGFSITANKKCRVDATVALNLGAAANFGWTLNSTELTTNFDSLVNSDDRVGFVATSGAGLTNNAQVSIELNAGDVLRVHGDGTAASIAGRSLLSFTAKAQTEHVATPANAVVESALYTDFAGYGSTATAIPYYTNERVNTVSETGTISNDSTNGWKFTASDDVVVHISASWSTSADNQEFGLSVNGDPATGVLSLATTERKALGHIPSANGSATVSTQIEMSSGDVLRVHGNSAGVTNTAYHVVSMVVTKKYAKFKVALPKTTPGMDRMNIVSALVTDGAGTTTVSEDESDFIDGNCTNPSAGSYTCTFTSGYWADTPKCWAQVVESSRSVNLGSRSTSSVSLAFETMAAAVSDTDFILFCHGDTL